MKRLSREAAPLQLPGSETGPQEAEGVVARAEGKFQTPEAVPWGHHSVFSLGFIKQIIPPHPRLPREKPQTPENYNSTTKITAKVKVFRNKIK